MVFGSRGVDFYSIRMPIIEVHSILGRNDIITYANNTIWLRLSVFFVWNHWHSISKVCVLQKGHCTSYLGILWGIGPSEKTKCTLFYTWPCELLQLKKSKSAGYTDNCDQLVIQSLLYTDILVVRTFTRCLQKTSAGGGVKEPASVRKHRWLTQL